jgi:hypothetical protein
MVNVMQGTEQTPPPASTDKTVVPVDVEDIAGAEVDELATTVTPKILF